MIRAIRPSAVARDDASLLTGWNIAPNVGYTVSLSVTASAVVVILANSDGSTLIGSGLALVGTNQPMTITPVSGQTVGMVDTDLGWHMLVTTDGTEGERTITIDPMVDLADEIHPIYTDDNMALARATAAINAGACYVDDVSVSCPLGLGAGLGGVVSAPVDGAAMIGQVESVTWTATPDGTSEMAVIRRHTPIAPDAYVAPATPPTLADDTAETDAATATSGNVLTNDTGTLIVVAVNGLSANVGEEIAGSAGGVFTIAEDGAWTFDPAGDFSALSGADTAETSVTYHASDGCAEASATLTVTVSSRAAMLWTPAFAPHAYTLDATQGVTNVSGAASDWATAFGPTYSVMQAASTKRPSIVSGGLDFDGSDDFLTGASIDLSSGWPAILLAKFDAVTSGKRLLVVRHDGVTRLLLAFSDTAGKLAVVNSAGVGYVRTNALVGTTATRMIVATSGGVMRMDGADAYESYSEPGFGLGSTNMLTICANENGNAPHDGIVRAVVIIPGSPDIALIQKFEGYLAHKWDALLGATTLVSALPSDHPYKSAPPAI